MKKIKVSGKVLDADEEVLEHYNGILTASVYDKPEIKYTLGTQDPVMSYEERKSLIFRGDVSVNKGEFQMKFIVPKNISYKVGEGKISMYSIDSIRTLDAAGSNVEIRVGGSSNNIVIDNTPPDIYLFLEDTTFQEGDQTSDHPRFLARIFDESGINIIENDISRGIVLELDGEREFVVNKFYKADLNDYRSGTVSYQLTDLDEGYHTVLLKVWDTFNNMRKAQTSFYVGEKSELIIQNVLNYPNPFTEETSFSFEHNRSGESLEVNIRIYSIRGELVKSIEGVAKNSEFRINDISWDGKGEGGKKLESGLYIYSVFVRSLLTGAKNSVSEKLIIIN